MRLEELTIDRLRGIRDITLKDLGDVNLILGGNDAGKTTVLEAVILSSVSSIDQIVRCSTQRTRMPFSYESYSQLDAFLSLFPFSEDPERIIELHARYDVGLRHKKIGGKVVVKQKPFPQMDLLNQDDETIIMKEFLAQEEALTFEGVYSVDGVETLVEISEDYRYKISLKRREDSSIIVVMVLPFSHIMNIQQSAYQTREQEGKTVRLLQIIDPDIQGIKLQKAKHGLGFNQILEHKKHGEIPLFTYGDGMKKILTLAGAVVAAENGILLIDEIETSLQSSLLSDVFSWLIEACRVSNVQLFATTHSRETISTLASCAVENPNSSLACYRLAKKEKSTIVRRFTEKTLDELVNRSGMDVR